MKKLLTLKTGFIAYFAVLGLFLALIFSALQHLTSSIEQLKQLEAQRYQATTLANEFKRVTESISRQTIAFVSSEQPEFQQNFERLLDVFTGRQADADGLSASMLARFANIDLLPDEQALLRSAYDQTLALSQIQIEAISTASGQFDDGAGGVRVALPNSLMAKVLVFSQQYTKAAADIATTIDALDQQVSQRLDARLEQAGHTSDRAFWLALVALALFFLVSALTLLLLYRSIKQPIAQGVALANELASGNLTARLNLHRQDEIGELLTALNGIGEGLQRAVEQIRHQTQLITDGSQTISSGNQDLALRTQEQSSSVQQTVGTMNQLAHTVRQNADNAQHADQLAQQASGQVRHGNQAAESMLEIMRDIGESSRTMGEITHLIRNIAFQTNILALNAAVEAARAGPQGRGFAVVATEVRQLALRSSDASRDIEALISRSVEQINAGSQAAASVGAAMSETEQTVEKVRTIVTDIAHASREQAEGVEQVSQAMTQLDQITRRNSQLVQHAAATTLLQLEQADTLSEVVAHFQLDETATQAESQTVDAPEPWSDAPAPKAGPSTLRLAAMH
ncbi:methyl-accepting chemotaxis protein [Alcaligenes sp. SDU_A2]|uniref:methyl-accepting chemotaxis protein n=1 Tax=Alcaligenes sp. SDU_A2 TaxID=3136634 RepID=UPI00311DD390